VRSTGGRSLGAIKLGGGRYNTKINHHVCINIIKLLSLPGIRATHDGLLRAPLTTIVPRGQEGGGGEDDLEPPTAAAWATATPPRGRRSPRPSLHNRTPVCVEATVNNSIQRAKLTLEFEILIEL